MGIECFCIQPTNRVREFLRRYSDVINTKKACPKFGFHTCRAFYREVKTDSQYEVWRDWKGEVGSGDERWPAQCAGCSYLFLNGDHRQIVQKRVWKRPATKDAPLQTFILDDAHVGAMFDAWWMKQKGPDGKHLALKTTDGIWYIDGPTTTDAGARTGPAVSRTGAPPEITAPLKWRGWKLVDGILLREHALLDGATPEVS